MLMDVYSRMENNWKKEKALMSAAELGSVAPAMQEADLRNASPTKIQSIAPQKYLQHNQT